MSSRPSQGEGTFCVPDLNMRQPRPGTQTERVVRELRTLAAEIGAGGRLPLYRDLIARFGVSGATLNSAIQVLESERLIRRTQGSGIFVEKNADSTTYAVLVDPFSSRNSIVPPSGAC
jgi:DNA-binding GntR family transcriptional regulator